MNEPRRRTPLHNAGIRVFLSSAVLLLLAAGCAYRGSIDTPPTLKVTWFSYLSGEDIKAECNANSEVRFRMIYNADYNKQLRTYEVTADGAGGAYFVARAQTGEGLDLRKFSLSDPLAVGGAWEKSQLRLDAAQLEDITGALAVSGAFGPAPVGLRLFSNEYYWVTSLCYQGQYHFNAWLYPSERYGKLEFPQVLEKYDETGVAVAPPQEVSPEGRLIGTTRERTRQNIFQSRVTADGLEGLPGI